MLYDRTSLYWVVEYDAAVYRGRVNGEVEEGMNSGERRWATTARA